MNEWPNMSSTSKGSMVLYDFQHALFRVLLQMDAEAVLTADGQPTGLNYYGKYGHPSHVMPQTEPSWTQRLEELLITPAFKARKERPYPLIDGCSSDNRCDDVIEFTAGPILWLENKGAWKEYWRREGKPAKFRSHLLDSPNS